MFGNRLKELREHKKISQEDLGLLLKLSPSAIGMYERGQREPDLERIKEIAAYFDVTIDFLLDKAGYDEELEKLGADINRLVDELAVFIYKAVMDKSLPIEKAVKIIEITKENIKLYIE